MISDVSRILLVAVFPLFGGCKAIQAPAEQIAQIAQLLVVDAPRDIIQASASTLGVVGYSLTDLVPVNTKEGKVYGNWCGSNHPNETDFNRFLHYLQAENAASISADVTLKPISYLDYVCLTHDYCYWRSHTSGLFSTRDCDHNLQNTLRPYARRAPFAEFPYVIKVLSWAGGSQYRTRDLLILPDRPTFTETLFSFEDLSGKAAPSKID